MAKQMDLAYAMANTTMNIFAPKKSVIVDMVMVQFITVILTLATILMFNASTMSSDQVAWMLGGLFGAILMAGALYTRINGV